MTAWSAGAYHKVKQPRHPFRPSKKRGRIAIQISIWLSHRCRNGLFDLFGDGERDWNRQITFDHVQLHCNLHSVREKKIQNILQINYQCHLL